jgi:hypothetical protein
MSNEGAEIFARSLEPGAAPDLLLQAVEILSTAASSCASDDPARALVFSNLGYALRTL